MSLVLSSLAAISAVFGAASGSNDLILLAAIQATGALIINRIDKLDKH